MLAARSDYRVTAVWDEEPARRAHWAKATGGREAASAADAIDNADGIVINSQTDRHADLVATAVKARKPLFVEKPLGMAAADAYAMADTIEAAGVIFQTGYFQRSAPAQRRIKQLIEAGDLGRITKATASNAHSGAIGDWFRHRPDAPGEDWNWMTDTKQSGVGAFGDLGTHALDILLWWLGDAARVTAQIDNVTNTYGCDESGQGMIRFTSGTTATLTAGWVDQADPVSYLVSGTEGLAAVIGGQLFVTRDGKLDLSKPEADLPASAPHAFELYLDAVAGREPAVPLVTAREAAYRSAAMGAMYDGAKNATWVEPKRTAEGRR
jgi:predicted dehydrogenase